MISHPTARELLDGVAAWLEEGAGEASQPFQRRLALNALNIVRREQTMWPALRAAAIDRMAGLLGRPGSYADLTRGVAQAIAEGAIAYQDPRLLDHLRRTALDLLAIDQPSYRHELEPVHPETTP